jgi:hypothetical protein
MLSRLLEIVGGLANHGDTAKVLANRLDGGERSIRLFVLIDEKISSIRMCFGTPGLAGL